MTNLSFISNTNELPWHTAEELMESLSPTVPWRARPWLADGAVTELDAKVKVGKTTLILDMVRCLLDGTPFLGFPTVQTPAIVYLTEQGSSSFREALVKASLIGRPNLHILFAHEVRGNEWANLVEAAVEKCVETGSKVLLVDTLSQFAALRGEAENNAGDALEAIEPLQLAAAQHNLAVLFTRHERKSSGRVGDTGRGSSAFSGAVDIIIALHQGSGSQPNTRVLQSLSRFEDTPDSFTCEWDGTVYLPVGETQAAAVVAAKRAILDMLPISGSGMVLETILSRGDLPRSTAKRALDLLEADDLITKTGDGKKSRPFHYLANARED